MTCTLEFTHKQIGLAAAGAASLGLTLAEGLLLPQGHLTRRAAATLPAVPAPAPEPAAAAQPVLPAPAPLIAEPEPVESRPMTPEEEDALLGTIGA